MLIRNVILLIIFIIIFGSIGYFWERSKESDKLASTISKIAAVDSSISKDTLDIIVGKPSIVDMLLNNLKFGSIAFNVPANVNIEDSFQIQLILSLAADSEKLKLSIIEEGEKEGATVKVSNRMEARLTGAKFQIATITPEIQAVSEISETVWRWEIFPKEEGKHKLHLAMLAFVEIDGNNTPRTVTTFHKIIIVDVTTKQKLWYFFKNNWQWLWIAILVPIATGLWKRRKNKNISN